MLRWPERSFNWAGAIERKLRIGEHETTADGEYSLVTEECLAACDHAPCLMINEKMQKCIRPDDVEQLLADPANDRLDMPRSDLFDAPPRTAAGAEKALTESVDGLGTTSDVEEMKDAE